MTMSESVLSVDTSAVRTGGIATAGVWIAQFAVAGILGMGAFTKFFMYTPDGSMALAEAMGKAVKGEAKFASEYQGTTYYLANAKAKMMFDKAPQDYVVAYEGWCATGVAHGMKVHGDPTVFVVQDGKTYLFSNEKAKAMFTKDEPAVIAKADENWPTVEQKGS
jgi:YHS domain-containing protein